MAKKLLWDNATHPNVRKALEKDIPPSGPVKDSVYGRPALEAYRQLAQGYHDHYNNGSGNERQTELNHASRFVGTHAPSVRRLQEEADAHFPEDGPEGRHLEKVARKVAAEAAKEHRRVYGHGHNMSAHGEGKKYGDKS